MPLFAPPAILLDANRDTTLAYDEDPSCFHDFSTNFVEPIGSTVSSVRKFICDLLFFSLKKEMEEEEELRGSVNFISCFILPSTTVHYYNIDSVDSSEY